MNLLGKAITGVVVVAAVAAVGYFFYDKQQKETKKQDYQNRYDEAMCQANLAKEDLDKMDKDDKKYDELRAVWQYHLTQADAIAYQAKVEGFM